METSVVSIFIVELEGIEPSSKRGLNKLSTCLAIDLIFEHLQARGHQQMPYLLNFGGQTERLPTYFRIFRHHLIQTSRNGAMG